MCKKMFGLKEVTIEKLKIIFSKYPQIEKVVIYGSRAKGNYRNGSDIDLTLIGKNLTLKNSVYPIEADIENLYLPYFFDISIKENIDNQNLIEHINRIGKIFYETKI